MCPKNKEFINRCWGGDMVMCPKSKEFIDSFLKENDLLKLSDNVFGKSIFNESVRLTLHKLPGSNFFAMTEYIRLEHKHVETLHYKEDSIKKILLKFVEDCRRIGIPHRTLNSVKFMKDV